MYARYFSFKSTPERRKDIEALADDIVVYTRSLKGFVSATYLISEDETHYGSFTIWDSKQDAEAGGAAIREKSMSTLEGLATAPPEVVVVEVYQPKS